VKHGDGCYQAPPDLPDDQVVLRYAPGENPNGSDGDIAAVANADGNVMGLMPHPEHAVDTLLGSGDGALLLASLVDTARERSYARA
jgi:phosphoribosylformylglycinamidine synthase